MVKLAAAPPARIRKTIMPKITRRENLRFDFSELEIMGVCPAPDSGVDCCELI